MRSNIQTTPFVLDGTKLKIIDMPKRVREISVCTKLNTIAPRARTTGRRIRILPFRISRGVRIDSML